MASVVDICNSGLNLLGASTITQLNFSKYFFGILYKSS